MKYSQRGEISVEEEEASREAVRRVVVERGGSTYGHGSISAAVRLESIHVPHWKLRQVIRELDPKGVDSRM